MHIAITGCGWVTPRVAGTIDAVLQAYSGSGGEARAETRYEPIGPDVFSQFTNLPGEAAKEDAVRLAAVALEIAWRQSELGIASYASQRKGLVLGCALAGISGMIDFANDVRTQSTRFVSPIRFPQTVGNYICGALARGYDFRGPASTIACGSASSLESIREGCALLSSGLADVVLAGGSELLTRDMVDGLSQPDVRYADGACLFVLENESESRKRGAKILATIPGNGATPPGPDSPKNAVVSTAGFRHAGAISIDHWTGRTLGSDGAAALAAAIGSTHGLDVPTHGLTPSDCSGVNFGSNGTSRTPMSILIRATDTANRTHELRALVQLPL